MTIISVAGRTLMAVWATQRDGKLEGRRLAKKLMSGRVGRREAIDRLSCNRIEHVCDWVDFKGVAGTDLWETDYTLHIHTHTHRNTHAEHLLAEKAREKWWGTNWVSSFQLQHSMWFCGVEMTLREFVFPFWSLHEALHIFFSKVFPQISTFKTFSQKLAIGQFVSR